MEHILQQPDLENVNAEVGRVNIFKQTIGNGSVN